MNTEQHSSKGKKNPLTISLYVGSIITALSGAVLLISNIILYNDTVAQYVAMGYDAKDVTSQMFPSQLLPAILQSVALYGGIALALFAIAMISHKLSVFMDHSVTEPAAMIADPDLTTAEITASEENETVPEEAQPEIKAENDQADPEQAATLQQ